MRRIDGHTAVFGIIGNPIGHTLSPVIHNTISEAMGINAVYVPFAANGNLSSMVNGLYSLGVTGVNVTVPYKTEIIPYLSGIDPLAKEIGAVNTLKYTENGYYGYNTDILGLKRELEDEGVSLKGRDIVLLGAGGAARAVAFLCASSSPASITIVNRTLSKAFDICKDIEVYASGQEMPSGDFRVNAVALEDINTLRCTDYIVFQCTNIGLSPDDDACVLDDQDFYDRVSVGIDLIYKPAVTKFMKNVTDAGSKAYNGLKMLIYQAVSAYEIWNDLRVNDAVAGDLEALLTQTEKDSVG